MIFDYTGKVASLWTRTSQFLKTDKSFVDLKSNSALLYNKGHNFWKSVLTQKIPLNWIFPY